MKKAFALGVFLLLFQQMNAQNNVGIGTTNPNSNALLDLHNGTNALGLLLPKSDTGVFSLGPGDNGLFILDTTEEKIFFWNGNAWEEPLLSSGGFVMGTADPGELSFWSNSSSITGSDSLYWDNINGYLGIGTSFPFTTLSIEHPLSEGSDFGTQMIFTNGGAYSNAIIAESNNTGTFATGVVYARAQLAGYGPTPFGDADYAVWGSLPNNNGYAILATNGLDSLNPDTYAAFSGNTYSGIFMGGNVGIGTTAPAAGRLEVNIDAADASTQYGILISHNYSGASDSYGVFNNMVSNTNSRTGVYNQLIGVGTGNRLTGTDNYLNPTGTGNEAIALKGYVDNGGTGNRMGLAIDLLTTGSSTGPFYGGIFSVQNNTAAGVSYGVYVNSYGTGTNTYGLFLTGETENYISGNMGIGTTSPSSKLELHSPTSYGATNATTLLYGNTNFQNNAVIIEGNNTGNDAPANVYSWSRIAGYGPNPFGTTNYGIWAHQPGSGVGGYSVVATYGPDELNPTTYAAIGGSNYAGVFMGGRVGIGTQTPISDFHINQSGGSGSAQGTGGIDLENGVYRWRMYNSINFIRFNYSDNSGATYSAKSYITPTDGSYNIVSDASMKKQVSPMPTVLDKVMDVEILRYKYMDNDEGDPFTYGAMAQDLLPIFPEMVSKEETGTIYGVDYTKFGIISIKAIQELNETIERLEERVAELEGR